MIANEHSMQHELAHVDGARTWRDALVLRMFRAMHVFEQDNFDSKRYGGQQANVLFTGQQAGYYSFVMDNPPALHRAGQLFA